MDLNITNDIILTTYLGDKVGDGSTEERGDGLGNGLAAAGCVTTTLLHLLTIKHLGEVAIALCHAAAGAR